MSRLRQRGHSTGLTAIRFLGLNRKTCCPIPSKPHSRQEIFAGRVVHEIVVITPNRVLRNHQTLRDPFKRLMHSKRGKGIGTARLNSSEHPIDCSILRVRNSITSWALPLSRRVGATGKPITKASGRLFCGRRLCAQQGVPFCDHCMQITQQHILLGWFKHRPINRVGNR